MSWTTPHSKHETEQLRERLIRELSEGTPRGNRARRFADIVQHFLRDFLPADRDCRRAVNEHLLALGYEANAEIINVPPECDALDKLALERRMLEAHIQSASRDKELTDLRAAAEAFRRAMIESGAVNHVSQNLYMDQLRALECALNPVHLIIEKSQAS